MACSEPNQAYGAHAWKKLPAGSPPEKRPGTPATRPGVVTRAAGVNVLVASPGGQGIMSQDDRGGDLDIECRLEAVRDFRLAERMMEAQAQHRLALVGFEVWVCAPGRQKDGSPNLLGRLPRSHSGRVRAVLEGRGVPDVDIFWADSQQQVCEVCIYLENKEVARALSIRKAVRAKAEKAEAERVAAEEAAAEQRNAERIANRAARRVRNRSLIKHAATAIRRAVALSIRASVAAFHATVRGAKAYWRWVSNWTAK